MAHTGTLFFWHGGDLTNIDDTLSQRKGRYEYGSGLYLTTKYEVAKKYAKGSRKLYLVEVQKGTDISDSFLKHSDLIAFIKKHVTKAKQNEIISRLDRHVKDGQVKAFIFNNIMLNEGALKPAKTVELQSFYVSNGIDYEIVNNPFGWGEDMMILYNMKKIVKRKVIGSKDEIEHYDLRPVNEAGGTIKFAVGGEIPDRYKSMGFSKVGQKLDSTRPEKKWMVLAKKGDEYKVVHGGYKGMQDYSQHKDPERRKRFWDRMGGENSAKANDVFSPLYWHKKFSTWEDGGVVEADNNENAGFEYSRSKSRGPIPNVRGGWTKEKIIRYVKSHSSDVAMSAYGLSKHIVGFDSWQQLKDHIYYHGTPNYIEKGLKPSIAFSERYIEQNGGGGYGQRYFGISLTKRKRTAESFAGMSRGVTIYPVILKKDAVVIERTDLSDSADIEDIVVDLYNEGVDAVWIGGGEDELVVVNPYSIVLYKDGAEHYQVYGGYKSTALTDDKIKDIYELAITVNKSTKAKLKTATGKDERNAILRETDPFQFEDGGKVVPYTDEHGKFIVYDDGNFYIAVNDEKKANYVTLWKHGVKGVIGTLEANESKMLPKEYSAKGKFLSIRLIDIHMKYRGNRMANKMYQALLKYSGDDIVGIFSYLPQRRNKTQVPRIYRKYKTNIVDGDYEILMKEDNMTKFAEGGEIDNACIEEVVKIVNAVQPVSDHYIADGKLIIVFKDELMVYAIERINYHLETFQECHHLFETHANINYKENYKSISIDMKKRTENTFEDGGLVDSIQQSMTNLQKNGIVLKEGSITVICYNTGGQSRKLGLYNQPLIYNTVSAIDPKAAAVIIVNLNHGVHDEFEEGNIPQYEKSEHLIVMNQNEVLYHSGNPNSKFEDGGAVGKKLTTYQQRINANMQYMGSDTSEWSAVEVTGFKLVENEKGEMIEMPTFSFPAGYKKAPTLFPSSNEPMNCELCGKMNIKTAYHIKNDSKKLIMLVGSECVTHFGEGRSGKQNLRDSKLKLAMLLDADLIEFASELNKRAKRIVNVGYGRASAEWARAYLNKDGMQKGEYWDKITELSKSLNPDIAFEKKDSLKENLKWHHVFTMIKAFGYDSEIRSLSYSSSTRTQADTDKALLSWFKRNELVQRQILEQIAPLFNFVYQESGANFQSKYLTELNAQKFAKGGTTEKLLAPNGKPSNLTPEQYRLVRTPAFKAWFGDWENDPANASKVVDENGEPLVVYHGTTHGFNEFTRDRGNVQNHFGIGYYFSSSLLDVEQNYMSIGPDLTNRIEQLAERIESEKGIDNDEAVELAKEMLVGGEERIMHVFLNFRNPIVIIKGGGTYFDTIETYDEESEEYSENEDSIPYKIYQAIHSVASDFYGADSDEIWNELSTVVPFYEEQSAYDVDQVFRKLDSLLNVENENGESASYEFIRRVYEEAGFDGIIMDADTEFGNKRKVGKKMKMDAGTMHYIGFESTQIKLADGSNTTFDGSNPDIRYAKGGLTGDVTLQDIAAKFMIPVPQLQLELNKGIKIEMEHTTDRSAAEKIALDHLAESPLYYVYLAKMEDELKMQDIDAYFKRVQPVYAKGGAIEEVYEFRTPTGAKSTLTYIQQVIVRTKEFKAWFGDWQQAALNLLRDNRDNFDKHYAGVSYAINHVTLEPLVVYHGTATSTPFYEFDASRAEGVGRPYAYFADNREYALNFTTYSQRGAGSTPILYQCFLKVMNPFYAISSDYEMQNQGPSYWREKIAESLYYDRYKKSREPNSEDFQEIERIVSEQIGDHLRKSFQSDYGPFWRLMAGDTQRKFKTFLMLNKYDSVRYGEEYSVLYDPNNPSQYTRAWTVFDADQIKLADGRNIDFNPFQKDIRMEDGGKLEAPKEDAAPAPAGNFFEKMSSAMGVADETREFAHGGTVYGDGKHHTTAKDGGFFKGKSHAEGGIKAVNTDTGQIIEVEGNEVIINKRSVADTSKKEFEGEMLTNREILSRINQSGGGVAFADGGEIEASQCKCSGKTFKFGGETLEDYEIVKRLTGFGEKVASPSNAAIEYVDQFVKRIYGRK